ncbi:hypothetical protein [Streptomyces sp. NPDC020330]|uniref:hypothetical protein n=1 Tax=unclassified Streptomyces TaxID=2593676 RepID=UPI0037A0BE71
MHWLYWMAAHTVLAVGSYVLLRRPSLVARVRRLRPTRFGESRLPLGLTANFFQRSLSGVNIGIMVALLFLVVVAPVSAGAWIGQLDESQRQRAEREEQTDRFAELASLAITRILDTLDLGGQPGSATGGSGTGGTGTTGGGGRR